MGKVAGRLREGYGEATGIITVRVREVCGKAAGGTGGLRGGYGEVAGRQRGGYGEGHRKATEGYRNVTGKLVEGYRKVSGRIRESYTGRCAESLREATHEGYGEGCGKATGRLRGLASYSKLPMTGGYGSFGKTTF